MSEPSSTTISSLSPTSSGATSPTIPPTMSSADIQEFPAPPVASHFTMQIVDLKSSLNFFATVLGFKVLRHEEFDRAIPEVHGNGNHYKGRWSRTIVSNIISFFLLIDFYSQLTVILSILISFYYLCFYFFCYPAMLC